MRVLLLAAALVAAGCGARQPEAEPAEAAGVAHVLWAIGDGAENNPHARRVARRVAREDPERILYLGDVYLRGTAREFRLNMRGVYGALVERMLPTPGNHEWELRREGYLPFWRRVRGRPLPLHYATRVGRWTLLSLNSEDVSRKQLSWLREQLQEDTTCRIAFWHRPRFSAGRHGDSEGVAPLWNALRGRAKVVLGGHDHALMRLAPVDGLVQIVSGAAGRHLYEVDETDPRVEFADARHFGGVRLVLRGRRARVDFVSARGRLLDRSRVRCR